MTILTTVSSLLLPAVFLLISVYGFLNKVPIYDAFLRGASAGLKTVGKLLPTLIGILVGVALLRASGLLDALAAFLAPALSRLGFPAELLPLSLLRLFSSSGATGLALDLFSRFGPDSSLGRMASVLLCCTETVFYTCSLYFSHAGIRQTRYTIPCALVSNLSGIAVSVALVRLLF